MSGSPRGGRGELRAPVCVVHCALNHERERVRNLLSAHRSPAVHSLNCLVLDHHRPLVHPLASPRDPIFHHHVIMGGPNLEVVKFGIYVFFPILVLFHYGKPEWYAQNVLPVRNHPRRGPPYKSDFKTSSDAPSTKTEFSSPSRGSST